MRAIEYVIYYLLIWVKHQLHDLPEPLVISLSQLFGPLLGGMLRIVQPATRAGETMLDRFVPPLIG